MKSGFLAVAALSVLAAAPAPGSDVQSAGFQVGGVSYSMPLPAGYCLPVGKDVEITKLLAAGDTTNVTHLMLVRCDEGVVPGANDYTFIKTPVAVLTTAIDRPALLEQLGAEFDKKVDTQSQLGEAGKSLSDIAGTKIDIGGTFAPRGKDDVCGYMAGVLHVTSAAITFDQPVALCMTAVGGRVLSVYRAGKKGDVASLLTLMREARAMALTIKPAGGG